MAVLSPTLSFKSSAGFAVLLLVAMILQVFLVPATSGTIVTHLPGFQGPLPFHLETGYVTVGEPEDEIELFYYFIKSGRNPKEDPLIQWMVGGPGCSVMSALFFEIGPLLFKSELYNGTLPTIIPNTYGWTQVANFLFVDLPVNTGFSYAKAPLKSTRSDYQQIRHGIQFLRKWLVNHPEYLSNPFYIGGHSYIGTIGPTLTLEIANENEKGIKPYINLQGYMLGNPRTNWTKEDNTEPEGAHRLALISDELYESLKRNCRGAYQPFQIEPSNTPCLNDVAYFKSCISKVNPAMILEPQCGLYETVTPKHLLSHRFLRELTEFILQYKVTDLASCPAYVYVLSEYWANDKDVQRSLGVRPGANTGLGEFSRCRKKPYVYQILDSTEAHAQLSVKGRFRSLVYSGDHDLWVSYISTQEWIRSLNYSIVDDWRPWFAEDQVGGYTRTYANRMTFATVKGGKHVATMNRPKETWFLFQRWIDGRPV